MEKRFIKGNIFILTVMLMFDAWYMFSGELFAKTIASILFFVAGIINATYCMEHKADLKYPKWMVIALACAMIADVVINLNFYLGVVIFAIAHVFYFVSDCKLDKVNPKDLVC